MIPISPEVDPSQQWKALFGGPYNKVHKIFGSRLGLPLLREISMWAVLDSLFTVLDVVAEVTLAAGAELGVILVCLALLDRIRTDPVPQVRANVPLLMPSTAPAASPPPHRPPQQLLPLPPPPTQHHHQQQQQSVCSSYMSHK